MKVELSLLNSLNNKELSYLLIISTNKLAYNAYLDKVTQLLSHKIGLRHLKESINLIIDTSSAKAQNMETAQKLFNLDL
jgi:hypothetical protein